MKFKEYMIEKITKREYKKALENDNINAGCEFEFYIDEDKRGGSSIFDRSLIEQLIKKSDREIEDFNMKVDKYQDEVKELYDREKELEEEINDIDNDISVIEKEIEETEEKIDSIKEDINDLGLDDDQIDKDNLKKLKYLIDRHKDIINTLKNDIDKLEDKKRDIEEEYEDIKDGKAQEDLIEKYEPYPSVHEFPSFFDLVDEFASVDAVYRETDKYYNEQLFDIYKRYSEIEKTEELFSMFFNYYPEDLMETFKGDTPTEEEIEELDFPYNLSNFDVIEDSSLGDNGIEIVTSTEELPDLIEIIEEVFKWIDKIGYTDNSCGFHVHMSMDKPYKLDPLKLLLFVEEGRIYKDFEERMFNEYAINIKKGHFDSKTPFTIEHIKEFAEKKSITKSLNFDKFIGVHLVDLKANHVEFRYMGGKDYHRKYKQVEEVIANYAYWLSIACDPEYKKKEYIKKLNKMVNYYNALYLFNLLKLFKSDVEDLFKEYKVPENKLIKIFEKISKLYMESLKALPKFNNYNIKNKNLKDSVSLKSNELTDKFKKEVKKYIELQR
jgi:hypothetical protein